MTADKRVCDAAQEKLEGKQNWFTDLNPEFQNVGIKYCTDIGSALGGFWAQRQSKISSPKL